MSILHRRKKVKTKQLKRLHDRGELTPREQDELDALEAEEGEGAESQPLLMSPPTREQLEQQRETKRRELDALELQLNAPAPAGPTERQPPAE